MKNEEVENLIEKIEKNLDKLFSYKTPNVSAVKQSVKQTIKSFISKNNTLKEDANATAGNTGGMGDVSAANPSSTPGDVAGSTTGSGDIGHSFGTYMKSAPNFKKKKMKKVKSFEEFKK